MALEPKGDQREIPITLRKTIIKKKLLIVIILTHTVSDFEFFYHTSEKKIIGIFMNNKMVSLS